MKLFENKLFVLTLKNNLSSLFVDAKTSSLIVKNKASYYVRSLAPNEKAFIQICTVKFLTLSLCYI